MQANTWTFKPIYLIFVSQDGSNDHSLGTLTKYEALDIPDRPQVCSELSSQMNAVCVCHLQIVINVSVFSELIIACLIKSRFQLLSMGSENKDQSRTRLPASYKKVIIITAPLHCLRHRGL